jgi:alkylated DNA repair protein alkB family protein 7
VFPLEKKPLKLACSLLKYKKKGYIAPHVDSKDLSGDTVVVISFNSPVVVSFYSLKHPGLPYKLFVPPKSMYAMSGEARYDWAHAILKGETTYNSEKFKRGVRYAVVLTPPGPNAQGSVLLDYD